MKVNAETKRWTKRYQTALHRYLTQGTSASLQPALKLGKQAAVLGLETLTLSSIHKKVLASMPATEGSGKIQKSVVSRAKLFFAETLVPIEKTHDAAMKANASVAELTKKLHRRTAESESSTRDLEQSILKRKQAEAILKKSGSDHTKLLRQSNSLHKLLREQTQKILTTQEKERKKTSLQLQDEVAQMLLAISIGLLALKTAANANARKFSKEIDNTQRLVQESLKELQSKSVKKS